jgi:hypothetical protein
MRKWISAIVFLFVAGLVFAHPPTVDKVVYDPDSKVLTVTVVHNIMVSPVTDPAKHYVKEVDVTVNGNKVVTQTFVIQETPQSEVLVYKIFAASGDKVTVDATCVLRGSGTKTISIP